MGPMELFLLEIWAQRHELENPEISLHTGIDRFFYSYETGLQRNSGEEEKVINDMVYRFKTQLPRILPHGKAVQIYLWKQRENDQRLHNRYILTEACGVAFGTGLDQIDENNPFATDDLHLMQNATFSIHRNEFLGQAPAFDLAIEPFIVQRN